MTKISRTKHVTKTGVVRKNPIKRTGKRAQEFYACNECGNYPIIKIVDIDYDKLSVAPRCPKCGGKTHFEKVYEIRNTKQTYKPNLKGNPAYDLFMQVKVK